MTLHPTRIIAILALTLLPNGFVFGQDSRLLSVSSAITKAEQYEKQGKRLEAANEYERARSLAVQVLGNNHTSVAALTQAQGSLYRDLGDYAKADSLYAKTLEICLAIGDTQFAAEAANNLATIKWELGDYAESQKIHERGLAMMIKAHGENSPLTAVSRNNLATVYKEVGDYSLVEPMVTQSIKILRSHQPKYASELAGGLMSLADLHSRQGNYPRAELLLLEAMQIKEKALGPKHVEVCRTRNNLAALYFSLGQFTKAESMHKQNLAAIEGSLGKNHPDIAKSLLNLALCYQTQKKYDEAGVLYERAIALRKKILPADHPDISLTLHNYGQLCTSRGDYPQALQVLEEALTSRLRTYGANHTAIAFTKTAMGDVYHSLKEFEKAKSLYEEAWQIRKSQLNDTHPSLAHSLSCLGEIEAATLAWDDCVAHFDASRRGFRQHVDQSLPSLPESDQIAFLKYVDEPQLHSALSLVLAQPQNRDVIERSAGWVLNGKAVSQQALAQRALLARDTTNSQLASAVKTLLVIRKQLASLMMLSESKVADPARQKRIEELLRQEQAQSRQLSEQGGRSIGSTTWIDTDLVRQTLPKDSVLVEIMKFKKYDFQFPSNHDVQRPERYVAWVVPSQDRGPIRIIDLGDASLIDEKVRTARKAIQEAPSLIRENGELEAEEQLAPSLRDLATSILYPLLEAVEPFQSIYLSPDSSLWLVPWNALPLPDNRYAIEKLDIRFLVTGRDLVRNEKTFEVTNPIMFADPDFNLDPAAVEAAAQQILQGKPKQTNGLRAVATSGKFKLGTVARLPGTQSEAEAVLPQLEQYANQKAKIFSGQFALEAIFKTLRQPRVLVLSTHGFFEEETTAAQGTPNSPNPLLRCGLLLAGCNKPIDASVNDGEDGILTGLEIVNADLRGTELVVLSACETGLGDVRNGEGVSGLRQAFQLAGARSVVSTLWQVPDRETARLMAQFFTGLAQSHDKAASLRESQLQLIQSRRDRKGAAHPFFWAAFTITGE